MLANAGLDTVAEIRIAPEPPQEHTGAQMNPCALMLVAARRDSVAGFLPVGCAVVEAVS
jgi:hypothetical protein